MSDTATDTLPAYLKPPTVRDVEAVLGKQLLKAQATGSRVICPAALLTPQTDYDFIAHVVDLRAAAMHLIDAGFEAASSMTQDGDGLAIDASTKFASLRKGTLNVIATQDAKFFGAFCLATRVATKLGLTSKAERVTLFQAMLYGNG